MSVATVVGWVVIGLGALVVVAAFLGAIGYGLVFAWCRLAPAHWTMKGPLLRRPIMWQQFVDPLRRFTGRFGATDKTPTTVRRLLGFGPWTVYSIRFKPANPTRED